VSGLPDGWVVNNLGAIIELVGGGTPKTSIASYWNGKIPWLSVVDFNDDNRWVLNTEKSITEAGLNHSSTKLLDGDDLIISARGTVGALAQLKKPMSFNQSCYGIKEKNNISNISFLYYLIKFSLKKINKNVHGAVFDTITKQTFDKIFINLPPLPEQKSIANILSSFDEKIELLREQNKTLETLAQTIFKEWFVNFNYPDATGDMVDSELGEIPKGWCVYDLNELVDTVNGYSYKGKELVESSDEALVTLKSFNRNGGFQTRGFKPFVGIPKQQQEVKVGDLVVAHTDLTQDAEVLGNPAFIFENAGYSKMYITMDLVKVVSKNKNIDNALVYYIMKDRRFKGHCIGYSNGTTVLHLSKKSIPEYKIALPENLQLAKEFSNYANSLTNKISNNIYHIQTLTKTRDTLLPKLMSGEVRVN